MWDLFFGNSNSVEQIIQISLFNGSYNSRSEFLKTKRDEQVAHDSKNGNLLLINNPNREVTLRQPTVLVNRDKR